MDGIWFDSQREYQRWCELRLLERAGSIQHLRRQVEFPLYVHGHVLGELVGHYVADFVYTEYSTAEAVRGQTSLVVEDVKGFRTPLYIWKRRHFELQYRLEIRET